MPDHNLAEMSESEEMYLITIARLIEQGVEAPVPIPLLAGELSIQPVSANQMVHKSRCPGSTARRLRSCSALSSAS